MKDVKGLDRIHCKANWSLDIVLTHIGLEAELAYETIEVYTMIKHRSETASALMSDLEQAKCGRKLTSKIQFSEALETTATTLLAECSIQTTSVANYISKFVKATPTKHKGADHLRKFR